MEPATTPYTPALYLSFELGAATWKIAFTTGLGQRPRMRTVEARHLGVLQGEIDLAKARFGLASDAPVRSCYEAGRDGFWLHRALLAMGVENVIVDSASIEVKRRKKKVKTDRLDAAKLVDMLVRYHLGETRVWSVVAVPSVKDEDRRHLHRELETVKKDRRRMLNRIRSLLFTQGIRLGQLNNLSRRLEKLRTPTGEALPERLRARLHREWDRLCRATEEVKELVRQRRALLREAEDRPAQCAAKLLKLRSVGEDSSWLLAMEFYGWRKFRNGRQVGALAGLTPTPYQSGDDARELGISKAGNRAVRHIAIELAWSWLRYQPQSELSLWYQRRFAHGKSRLRRIGIVALARKLLIALWRYLETGVPPAGARLKTS
jgi:transposase